MTAPLLANTCVLSMHGVGGLIRDVCEVRGIQSLFYLQYFQYVMAGEDVTSLQVHKGLKAFRMIAGAPNG